VRRCRPLPALASFQCWIAKIKGLIAIPEGLETEDRCPALMPAIVLILKFLETHQIIGQQCSITLRKSVVV
jgi:hypothetical protein